MREGRNTLYTSVVISLTCCYFATSRLEPPAFNAVALGLVEVAVEEVLLVASELLLLHLRADAVPASYRLVEDKLHHVIDRLHDDRDRQKTNKRH